MRHPRAPLFASLLTALLVIPAALPARAAPRPAPGARPAPPPPPPAPPAPAASPGSGHRAGDWPAAPSGKRVSLEDGLSLDEALARIADAAGFGLVAHAGDLGERELTLRLRNVPVEDALDAVLEGTPLVATRRGDLVTVAPAPRGAPRPVLSGFAAPTGKRFTGDFQDAPADEALRKVAEAAGLSVVLPPGLRGTVTGHFKDAPVEDALRAILGQAGLVAAREGQVLTVARPGGASLVIEGGKRGVQVRVDGLDSLGGQIAEEVQHELQAEGVDGEEAGPSPEGKGKGEVLHGDQVIGPGEASREVVILGGSARLAPGASAREIAVIGGGVELGPGATVQGGVVALGGDIHVAPGARVGRDAVSVGGKIVIDAGGAVAGERVSVQVPGLAGVLRLVGGGGLSHDGPLWTAGVALLEFAVFFLLGLLTLLVAPRRVDGVAAALRVAPLKSVLVGILGWLAALPICVVLVLTVVGIPFVPVVFLALAVVTTLGFTALCSALGRLLPIPPRRGAAVAHLAIGVAALVLLQTLFPVLGALIWVAAAIWLLGVNLLSRFGKPPAPPAPAYATVPPPAPPAPPEAAEQAGPPAPPAPPAA